MSENLNKAEEAVAMADESYKSAHVLTGELLYLRSIAYSLLAIADRLERK